MSMVLLIGSDSSKNESHTIKRLLMSIKSLKKMFESIKPKLRKLLKLPHSSRT